MNVIRRIAVSALLVGVTACTAYGQTGQYGGPPGSQGQYDPYGRQPTDPYPGSQGQYDPYGGRSADPYYRQPAYGYDRGQAPVVDVGFFYNELSPYGEWVRHPYYGWVWFPRNVLPNWRPYSIGRWVESDYGWTWISDEPFGWATYHYGRWAWDPQIGWLWVPGTDWGPAWVSWQQGNGYVGWAPLPPEVGFQIGVGIRLGGFNLSIGIAPRNYAFVQERRFLDPRIGNYFEPEARNITIIHQTTNITNYTVIDNRVINHGVPVERIERAIGRKAPRLRVVAAPEPLRTGVQRDVISIYRPAESRLKTVGVAPRNNAGLPRLGLKQNRSDEPAPRAARPPAVAPSRQGDAPVPVLVAPRIKPPARQVDERQFQLQQKKLEESQQRQLKALEQIHRQEMARAQETKTDAKALAQRQAAEMKAQQEERQRAEQQLRNRQQIEVKAVQATEEQAKKPAKPPAKKAAKPEKVDKSKGDAKKAEKKPPHSS